MVGLAVELHEHEVPNFNHLWMVFVYHLRAADFGAFLLAAEVDMYFRAGTAGTCLSHLPEVVMLVAVDDV